MNTLARLLAATITAVAVSSSFAPADTVHLRDGRSLQGNVTRADNGWTVTSPDGGTTFVPADAVRSIELTHVAGADVAAGSLASLRRAAENLSDPRQAIDRLTQFIERHPDTPAGEEAKKDLAVWRDRLDKGMVRVGRDWITPDDRRARQIRALDFANQARQAMKENRPKDAAPLVDGALRIDPQNPTALYLRALLAAEAGQLVPARKDLEAVNAATPDHGPTLNNLAVVTWRQKRTGEALNYYDQAMRALPVCRPVLDNVAEALHALNTGGDGGPRAAATVIQRVTRRFAEQEPQLQALMARENLHRWGATWIDAPALDRIRAAEQENEKRIAAIQSEYDTTRKQIAGLDDRIASVEREIREIEAGMVVFDSNGNAVVVPNPQPTSPLRDEIQRLSAQRGEAQATLTNLAEQARTISRSRPAPTYTGVQQLIGPDGAPVLVTPSAVPATSRPRAAS